MASGFVTKEIESRLKQSPEHIFEVFLEIHQEASEVSIRYPADVSDEIIKTAVDFAYPCQTSPDDQSENFTFVILDSTGLTFRYGYCRRSNRDSTCLCIISYYPWFEMFYNILNDLSRLINSKSMIEVERFLSFLYNYKLMSIKEFYQNQGKELIEMNNLFKYSRPDQRKLPSMLSNLNFTVMFSRLSSDIMLHLFAHLLFERRILFISSKLFHLTACACGCLDLINPMHWQSIFLPILPESLIWTTQCTTPYIIGIHSSIYSRMTKNDLGDVVIVNIDDRTIESSYDDLNCFPKSLIRKMKKEIQQSSQLIGDHLARVFLRTMASILGNYANGFVIKNGKLDFDRDVYLQQYVGSDLDTFMTLITNTQMFEQFSRYRTYAQLEREIENDEFEMEVKKIQQSKKPKTNKKNQKTLEKATDPPIEQVQSKARKLQTEQRVIDEAPSIVNDLVSSNVNDVIQQDIESHEKSSPKLDEHKTTALLDLATDETRGLPTSHDIPFYHSEQLSNSNNQEREATINKNMDDSSLNPILLSSSAHLENVEQLIKNLEKQTLDIDNFEDILSNRHRQDIITKSFSSISSSTMAIDDIPDDTFLVKSISLTNTAGAKSGFNDENLSMDSLLTQRDLFENDEIKKQQTPPANDQSLLVDQDGAFSWDDQYDTRANYRLTFSTDKPQQIDSKTEKSHRHKHQHRHRKHRTNSRSNSTGSDDGLSPNLPNNMNDWSMRSSFNALEQSIEKRTNKPPTSISNQQQTSYIRSQSHSTAFSPQQQIPNNNTNNNTSPNSSTTSSSSSASWKRMKESQRTTSGIEPKETRPPSPLSLYKIFQQKSHMNASSTSPRSAFQFYRQQSDSIVPNNNDSMTISGEKMITEKPKSSQHQKRQTPTDRPSSQTNSSTDQAIQTSMVIDPSSNSPMNSRIQSTPTTGLRSESYDYLSSHTGSNSPHHLTIPSRQSPASISSSSIHKSLPDLAFISQYSKELPRSRTTSPLPPAPSSSINPTHRTSSPTIIQQKQDPEKPRTLKSIKRYKNSKHSTEPLGVFYSPQLRKTFAAVPASAVINGSNEGPKIIKMKLPPPSSYPIGQQAHQTSNLKSCLKYGPRATSCDIQAMLQDRKSPASMLTMPEPLNNTDSLSPTTKRRCSEADMLSNRPDNLRPPNTHTTGSSNDLNTYVLQDMPRERHSDYDISSFQQQNQTKKSVSFSENISKHLISPCNPAIKFDPSPEIFTEDNNLPINHDFTHRNKGNLSRKVTARYGEMRRCQTDVIVVDRVHHLHSFSESPPNEFRLQETDSLAPEHTDEDDQTMMEKMHVNIIDEPTPTLPTTPNKSNPTMEKMTSSNDKENKIPVQSINMSVSTITLNPTNDPSLDRVLERINEIVKRIFEIKRSEKAFFLTNENNTQFDTLLKNDLCTILQNILEHGLKSRKDLPLAKQITLWKIIETSIDHGQTLEVFTEAKQTAQNASPYWVYKFQAFIYILLNKNELINWLYYYMKQKDILQRYYQSPDALILVVTPSTFTLFDRFMAQLEKLSPLAFRLVYKPDPIPLNIDEQLNTSTISMQPTKSSARDWVMTMSRRTSKTLTQPIVQPNTNTTSGATAAALTTQQTDTLRTTLSRKLNSLFTKTNPAPPQRKTSSAVTAKLPTPKPQTTRLPSPAPTPTNRSRTPTAFANTTTAKPVIVSSPKSNHGNRTGVIRRGISPSVVVAPSPPPLNTSGASSSATSTFQSKIPRPSLNVDKPKSARYRSTAPPTK